MTDRPSLHAIKLLTSALFVLPNDLEKPAPLCERMNQITDAVTKLLTRDDLSTFDRRILERCGSIQAIRLLVDAIDVAAQITTSIIARVAGVGVVTQEVPAECFSSGACGPGERMTLKGALRDRLTGLIVGNLNDAVSILQLIDGNVQVRFDLDPDHADAIADAMKTTATQIRANARPHGSVH